MEEFEVQPNGWFKFDALLHESRVEMQPLAVERCYEGQPFPQLLGLSLLLKFEVTDGC
jgi:hypothetical protein